MSDLVETTTLPYVSLRGTQVKGEVLALIPLATVERYQVAPFELSETTLKLAIVHPEQLKQGFYTALKDIGIKIGKKVVLFRTDPASMQSLIKQYRVAQTVGEHTIVPAKPEEKSKEKPIDPPATVTKPVTSAATLVPPPLFQLGKTVAVNYLHRTPLAYARQQRVICVDFLSPHTYWFVSDEPDKKRRLIEQIAIQNKIVAHIVPVSRKDLDELLQYYADVEREEERKRQLEKQETEKKVSAPVSPPPVPVQAVSSEMPTGGSGMIVPDLKATIISTETEKGGLAGFFQRFGHPHPTETPEQATSPTAAAPTAGQPKLTETATPNGTPNPASPPAAATPPAATPEQSTVIDGVKLASERQQEVAKSNTSTDESAELGKLLSKSVVSSDELTGYVKDGSIPKIVAAIISFAIHEKASDIHLEVFQDEVRVRYRVDGQLLDVLKLPTDVQSAIVSRIKILSKLRLDETRVPQDGRFDVNFEDAQVDLRVSVMPTVHGEKVVMRILDKNRGITSLESLGIMGLAYQHILKSIERPFGVCLATGPTGSGKSTSLYAILKQIATPNVNVVTLEDPVEYEMKGINQSQIRPKIGFTFAEGLRSILRQDPNIIMVGEIRDGETANMATQAALTGHLVLSTLHTNDAAGAIPRLQNMGIESFLITSSLNVVIGQRLVRKICQNCKSAINLPQGIRDQFARDIEAIANINPLDAKRIPQPIAFYQGMGCAKCGGKGYDGRMGIYEVMMMSDAIEVIALKRGSGGQIKEQAQKDGMLTMYQDGLLKVVNGFTTLDEVLRESTNK